MAKPIQYCKVKENKIKKQLELEGGTARYFKYRKVKNKQTNFFNKL